MCRGPADVRNETVRVIEDDSNACTSLVWIAAGARLDGPDRAPRPAQRVAHINAHLLRHAFIDPADNVESGDGVGVAEVEHNLVESAAVSDDDDDSALKPIRGSPPGCTTTRTDRRSADSRPA